MSWPALNCPEQLGGTPDAPVLLGNRCRSCGEPYFPAARGCTRCSSTDLEPFELGGTGTLWSWTVQMFPPKPPYDGIATPEEHIPFGIGYIEMPSGLKVESRLLGQGESPFSIGQTMKLVLQPYRRAGTAEAVYTYAFEVAA